MQTIDDEEEHLQSLRQANALYTYAERTLCTCAQSLCFIPEATKTTWQTRSIQQGSNLLKQLAAPYRGQAEYQLYRLNTSEESIALKSCGTDREYIRPDGEFRGRCLPAPWCIAQSNGKRLMCPREDSQALACMLNLYCLKYKYKFILIFYETLYVYVKSILCK